VSSMDSCSKLHDGVDARARTGDGGSAALVAAEACVGDSGGFIGSVLCCMEIEHQLEPSLL
jgi:hypothetical protein